MRALDEYRRWLCPCGCGYLSEVAHAAENEFRFDVEPVRCHARTALVKESARRAGSDAPEALLFRAALRD